MTGALGILSQSASSPQSPTSETNMPRGRFISKCISVSEQVNELIERCGYEGAMFFTWLIPHLDQEGRISGKASTLRGLVVPLTAITTEKVEQILVEASNLGLIKRYKVGGMECLELPRFHEHQVGLRKDRESPSKVPPLDNSGLTPELLQSNSRSTPAKVACDPLTYLNLNLPSTSLELKDTNREEDIFGAPPVATKDVGLDSAVQQVFARYRHHHPKSSIQKLPVMDEAHLLIRNALKAGFSIEDCCKAIDGYHNSAFHQGANENNQKYLSLSLVFSDVSHIQKGIEMASSTLESSLLPASEVKERLRKELLVRKIEAKKQKEIGDGGG